MLPLLRRVDGQDLGGFLPHPFVQQILGGDTALAGDVCQLFREFVVQRVSLAAQAWADLEMNFWRLFQLFTQIVRVEVFDLIRVKNKIGDSLLVVDNSTYARAVCALYLSCPWH